MPASTPAQGVKRPAEDDVDSVSHQSSRLRQISPAPPVQRSQDDPELRILYEAPGWDVSLDLTALGVRSGIVRVCSQIMSSASDLWRDRLSDRVNGPTLPSVQDMNAFSIMMKLLHYHHEIYSRHDALTIYNVAVICRAHQCGRGLLYVFEAWFSSWFRRFDTQEDKDRPPTFVLHFLLLAALEYRSAVWFHRWSGLAMKDEHIGGLPLDRKKELELRLKQALSHNRAHLDNLKKQPSTSGLCLRCFLKCLEEGSSDSKKYVAHYDLSRCKD